MKEVYDMRVDPRCKHLSELTDQYHLLFRQLAEEHLEYLCGEAHYPEALCSGDFMVLYEVGSKEKKTARMADISKKLVINPSTATRRVNRLVANGLMTKTVSPNDDRCFDLSLTENGQALLDRMEELLYNDVQYVYAPIEEEELQTVYRYAEKCIGQLNELLEKNRRR